jgi:hypothetical protein
LRDHRCRADAQSQDGEQNEKAIVDRPIYGAIQQARFLIGLVLVNVKARFRKL